MDIVVSNALPNGGVGGLASMLGNSFKEGLWYGNAPEDKLKVVEGARPFDITYKIGGIVYRATSYTPEQQKQFYTIMANTVLWPICHRFYDPALVPDMQAALKGYIDVNRQYARTIAQDIRHCPQPVEILWVHDYHLMTLGEALKEQGQSAGFFLHIPFPDLETLDALPRDVVMQTFGKLTSYKQIGFQTDWDRQNFVDFLDAYYPGNQTKFVKNLNGQSEYVIFNGQRIKLSVTPAGIVPAQWTGPTTADQDPKVQNVMAKVGGREMLLAFGRMEPAKGVLETLRAFSAILADHPEKADELALVLICPTSRGEVVKYRAYKKEVQELVDEINWRYPSDKGPVVTLETQKFTQKQLLSLIRHAAVGVVGSLWDGLCLVAKEIVAGFRPNRAGVLVMGENTGAAERMRDGPLLINPSNAREFANALLEALVMPLAERNRRRTVMMEVIEVDTAEKWAADNLRDIRATITPVTPKPPREYWGNGPLAPASTLVPA